MDMAKFDTWKTERSKKNSIKKDVDSYAPTKV